MAGGYYDNVRRFGKYATGGYMVGGPYPKSSGYYSGPNNSHTNYSNNVMSVYQRGKKRVKKTPKSRVRDVVRNMAPAKHLTFSDSQLTLSGAGFTHNTLNSFDITAQIAQGVGLAQRLGDFADIQAVKINGYFATPTGSNAPVEYRIMVLWSNVASNVGVSLGANLGNTDVFLVNTGGGFQTTGVVNPRSCTVLDDRMFVNNDYVSAVATLSQFEYTVPVNKKQDYRTNAGAFGKKQNLYVLVIGSILGGVTGTTQVGNVALSLDCIFKDL